MKKSLITFLPPMTGGRTVALMERLLIPILKNQGYNATELLNAMVRELNDAGIFKDRAKSPAKKLPIEMLPVWKDVPMGIPRLEFPREWQNEPVENRLQPRTARMNNVLSYFNLLDGNLQIPDIVSKIIAFNREGDQFIDGAGLSSIHLFYNSHLSPDAPRLYKIQIERTHKLIKQVSQSLEKMVFEHDLCMALDDHLYEKALKRIYDIVEDTDGNHNHLKDPNTLYFVEDKSFSGESRYAFLCMIHDRYFKNAMRISFNSRYKNAIPWKKIIEKQSGCRQINYNDLLSTISYTVEDIAAIQKIYANRKPEKTAVELLQKGIKTTDKTYLQLINDLELILSETENDILHNPILFIGKTGVGKTKLVDNIHAVVTKRNQTIKNGIPIVKENCATLTGVETIMSRLFGHEKGSFTGADDQTDGLLKQADGGILFLDEVGELPLEAQAMLLKAIEEGVFQRFGPRKQGERQERVKSTFRLICATNRDLKTEVEKGKFRKDLFERIRTWYFYLPSLRDRLADIPNEINNILSDEAKTLKRAHIEFADDAKNEFMEFARHHTWEGNWREFKRMLHQMSVYARGSTISKEIALKVIANNNCGIDENKMMLAEVHNATTDNNDGTITGKKTAAGTPDMEKCMSTLTQPSPEQLISAFIAENSKGLSRRDFAELKGAMECCYCESEKTLKKASEEFYGESGDAKNYSSTLSRCLERYGFAFDRESTPFHLKRRKLVE